MSIKAYLVRLRKRVDSSPELKMKIMWIVDKLPIIKKILKKIEIKELNNDLEDYAELSKSAKDIYNQLKNKIEDKI